MTYASSVDDNALRVRIRFYNAGEESAVLAVDPSAAYEAFYVEAGGEKSFILRDEDGRLRAKKSLAEKIEPGGMGSWWAEFPPLPEDVASFDVAIPPARFEEVFVSSE